MYQNWTANFSVVAATIVAVSLAVLVHYEGLLLVSGRLQRARGPRRIRVLYGILSLLGLHVCQIWIFGAVAWVLLQWLANGQITTIGAAAPVSFLDVIYLSAATFSTVGFGDLVPVGPIRFLFGTEALVGLVLIGWSASFTYIEMERFWRNA